MRQLITFCVLLQLLPACESQLNASSQKRFKAIRYAMLLHGTGGDGTEHWFPSLKQKLESRGVKVFVPRFPTPEGQSLENWFKVIDKDMAKIGPGWLLVGHSMGGTFILRILERIKQPVSAAILVSPPSDDIGGSPSLVELRKTFVAGGFNWAKIRSNSKNTSLFHGDDDPLVFIASAKKLSAELKIPLRVIHGGGHLNDIKSEHVPLMWNDIEKFELESRKAVSFDQ